MHMLGADETYKYLGLHQTPGHGGEKAKEITIDRYRKRVIKALQTELGPKSKARMINTWALPVLRYLFPVLLWKRAELRGIGDQLRRDLRAHGFTTSESRITE